MPHDRVDDRNAACLTAIEGAIPITICKRLQLTRFSVARPKLSDAMAVNGHDERRTAREHGVLAEHDELAGCSGENVHGSVRLEAGAQTGNDDVDDTTDVVQLRGYSVRGRGQANSFQLRAGIDREEHGDTAAL